MSMDMGIRTILGRWMISLVALAAIWEILSPFFLGFSDQSIITQNCVIIGIFILLFSSLGVIVGTPALGKWADILNFVLGIWLIVTPFVLGYNYMNLTAMVSSVITGLIIAGASGVSYFELPAGGEPF